MDILYQLLPIITAFAADGDAVVSTVGDNVLKWAVSIGGAIAAALVIVSLVKDVASYAKGSGDGSILKIAGKVIFLLIILGTIAYVGTTGKNGGGVSGVASTIVDKTATEINTAVGN